MVAVFSPTPVDVDASPSFVAGTPDDADATVTELRAVDGWRGRLGRILEGQRRQQ